MELSFFIDREDAKTVEEEERNRFVKNVLLNIGLPGLEDIWPDDNITVEQKIELRKFLATYDIEIIDDGDRGLEIYVDNDVIAVWNKPKFAIRIDNTHINPNKRVFLEMTINCVSVFDDDTDTEEQE